MALLFYFFGTWNCSKENYVTCSITICFVYQNGCIVCALNVRKKNSYFDQLMLLNLFLFDSKIVVNTSTNKKLLQKVKKRQISSRWWEVGVEPKY